MWKWDFTTWEPQGGQFNLLPPFDKRWRPATSPIFLNTNTVYIQFPFFTFFFSPPLFILLVPSLYLVWSVHRMYLSTALPGKVPTSYTLMWSKPQIKKTQKLKYSSLICQEVSAQTGQKVGSAHGHSVHQGHSCCPWVCKEEIKVSLHSVHVKFGDCHDNTISSSCDRDTFILLWNNKGDWVA